jgi:hypothetical protein
LRASEATDEETARQLRRRLSLWREELRQTRARLEASRRRTRRLRKKTQISETRLAEQDRLLADRHSALRYRIADAVVGTALQAPGMRHLAKRRRSTEDGQIS